MALPSQQDDRVAGSVRKLLTLLDKTFRTAKTYGPEHQLSKKFLHQMSDELTAFLDTEGTLSFVVQRFALYYGDQVVYQKESPAENLAFKLYGVGIRELAFSPGLSYDDLVSFLEVFGAESDTTSSDEDLVTRLWDRNLSAISLVTAEEIVMNPEAAKALISQTAGTLNAPVSTLPNITAAEQTKLTQEPTTGGSKPGTPGERPGQEAEASQARASKSQGAGVAAEDEDKEDQSTTPPSSLPGFDLSDQERASLAQEIKTESRRDGTGYLLDIIRAILSGKKSEDLLSEVLDLCKILTSTLAQQGDWDLLNAVVRIVHDVKGETTLAANSKQQLSSFLNSLGGPDFLQILEQRLNGSPSRTTDGLLVFLLNLDSTAVPALCSILANLKTPDHRRIVSDALSVLALNNLEPVTAGLSDARGHYVQSLLSALGRMKNPDLARFVEPLLMHADKRVRREALRTLNIFQSTGAHHHLVSLLNDSDEDIRLSALQLLKTVREAIPFDAWAPVVTSPEFFARAVPEIRMTFQVMGQIVGDKAVPYWRRLLTQSLWTNRKQKLQVGILAADILGQLATAEAVAALEAGRKRFNRVIRRACSAKLAELQKTRQPKGTK